MGSIRVDDNTLLLVATAGIVYLVYKRSMRKGNWYIPATDYFLTERYPPRMRTIPNSMVWYAGQQASKEAANQYHMQTGPAWK